MQILKKCCLYKYKVHFLGYVVSAQGEDKKNCGRQKLVQTKGLSKIAGLLTFMLKIANSSENSSVLVDMAEKDEVGGNDQIINLFRLNSKFRLSLKFLQISLSSVDSIQDFNKIVRPLAAILKTAN